MKIGFKIGFFDALFQVLGREKKNHSKINKIYVLGGRGCLRPYWKKFKNMFSLEGFSKLVFCCFIQCYSIRGNYFTIAAIKHPELCALFNGS